MEARCILNRSLVSPGDCDHHTSAAAATNIWNDQIRQLVVMLLVPPLRRWIKLRMIFGKIQERL